MQAHKQNVEQDRAYLVNWINNTIKSKFIQISSLDQLSNGVIFCQLLNILYPGKVPLSKIFIKPKGDYEVSQNFKLFLSISEKVGLKAIDSFKLSKGKHSDMILLLLYLKKLIETKQRTGNITNLEINNLQSSVMLYKSTSPSRSANGSRVKARISVSPTSRVLVSQEGRLLPPLRKIMNPLEQQIEALTNKKAKLSEKIADILKISATSNQTNLENFKELLLKTIRT